MESEDWVKTVAIGAVLTLLSVLVVPALIVGGYVVRTIRERAAGATEPPAFDDWGGLLVDGLKAAVIYLVYMIVPIAVFAVTVGGLILGVLTGSETIASVGIAGFLGGIVVSSVLSLVFGYFAVAALVNFACKEDLSAAFDFGTVKRLAFSSDYAIPWLIAVGILIAANIVTNIFNFIPGLGLLIWAPISFYAYVVAAEILAGGYNDVMKRADETEPSAAAAV
jgi:hypothetical protein